MIHRKNNAKEYTYVLNIYKCIIGIILINPLFEKIISNTTILRGMEMFLFIFILYFEIKLYKLNQFKYIKGKTYSILTVLLAIISIGIIIRGNWPSSIKDIGLHILSPTLIYLLPFFILPLPNHKYFNSILKFFFYSSLFVIPIWILNITDLVQTGLNAHKAEGIGKLLPFLCAFLLGFLNRFSYKQKYIIIAIWAIFFILMLLNARRNVSFSLALYALIAYLLSIRNELKRNLPKFILILLGSIFALQIILLNFHSLTTGPFQNMANRAKEDTRSRVEELFFSDFMKSPVEDWIFGRGMDGGYYQITKNKETGEISDNRKGIETGYLNLMLKGGIIYGIIIISFIFISCKKMMASPKRHIQYIGSILLTYFIDLYTTNPICTFSVRSIIFWFMISVIIQDHYYNKRSPYKNMKTTNKHEIRIYK